MDSIVNLNRNWANFIVNLNYGNDDTDDQLILGFCAWASSKGTKYRCIVMTISDDAKNPQVNTDLASIIAFNNYSNITMIFGDINTSILTGALTATTDYNAVNGTITQKFKSQPGLAASVFTDTDAINLIAKGYNFYGDHATVSADYMYFQEGTITGKYLFIDNFDDQIWLAAQLQNSLITLFVTATKIVNNPIGYAQIKASVNTIMKNAIDNQLIVTGNTFDDATKLELKREAGFDISDQLTNNGYFFQIIPASTSERAQRISTRNTLWYTKGSAIHKLTIRTNLVF